MYAYKVQMYYMYVYVSICTYAYTRTHICTRCQHLHLCTRYHYQPLIASLIAAAEANVGDRSLLPL
jgi:hypothetical protein